MGMLNFFFFLTAFTGTGDLCGSADARVCIQNSTVATVNGDLSLYPGTAIVFAVPGLDSISSGQVSGTATRPYRLALEGRVSDNQDGVWSGAQILDEDALGYPAIRFVLEQGTLMTPVTISMQDITVCQRVIDGPGPVTLDISFWVSGHGKVQTSDLVLTKSAEESFGSCAAQAGHMPVPEDDFTLFVSNPFPEVAAITLDGQNYRVEPGQQLQLAVTDSGKLQTYAASMALPVVAFSDGVDLEAVGLISADHTKWFLPHVARDATAWDNRWIFANGSRSKLTWQRADEVSASYYPAGRHVVPLTTQATATSAWARLQASQPINGFLSFSRSDGMGAAWVNALRLDEGTGKRRLYLPHVAADSANFWTGYSLANPNTAAAEVTLSAFDDGGKALGDETFQIPAGENEVGLIGLHRLAGVAGVSWVQIDSDLPIAGLELIGANNLPQIAGFLLPDRVADRYAFPLLRAGSDTWSGLALLNVGEAQFVTLTYFSEGGSALPADTFWVSAGQKVLRVAPIDAAHAILTGADLVCFSLTGAGDGRIAGYLGLAF